MEIKELNLCYQCGKCTAGCPFVPFMDYTPHRLVRFIQLKRIELVLKSKAIFICISCKTCSARCPKNIDLAAIMNKLKLISEEKGLQEEKNIFLFHKLFKENVLKNKRLFELGLILKYNLLSGNPLKDISLGILMLKKGKLFHK